MANAYVNDLVGNSKQSGNIVSGPSDHRSNPGPEVIAASTLEGNSVVNHQDEELGTILKDIMIDVPQGQVAYAVLESGGMLGMGSKLFAIP
jgi:hypothetical protein